MFFPGNKAQHRTDVVGAAQSKDEEGNDCLCAVAVVLNLLVFLWLLSTNCGVFDAVLCKQHIMQVHDARCDSALAGRSRVPATIALNGLRMSFI
jgi:hypothetical protein